MSNSDEIHVKCPHCNDDIFILIYEINCNVFRHGIYKDNLQQMDPHAKKSVCEKLKRDDLIFGCGKPFSLDHDKKENKFFAVKCDYI